MHKLKTDASLQAERDERATGQAYRILRREHDPGKHEWTGRAQRALRMASPLLLLAIWELLSRSGALDTRFFPPPSVLVGDAVRSILDGTLIVAAGDSLRRLVLGFGIGAVAGILVGLWLGLSVWSRCVVEPWIHFTYPVPKLALFPLLVLLVGFGELPIVILLAIAVFYIVAINTLAGVLSIKPVLIDVGRDCNATFSQSFVTIALPAAMPHIFTSLEIAIGIAFIVLVAAEFVGAKTGLGAVIWSSWQVFDVGPMYVAIVLVSTLGYGSVMLTRRIGEFVMPWRARTR